MSKETPSTAEMTDSLADLTATITRVAQYETAQQHGIEMDWATQKLIREGSDRAARRLANSVMEVLEERAKKEAGE